MAAPYSNDCRRHRIDLHGPISQWPPTFNRLCWSDLGGVLFVDDQSELVSGTQSVIERILLHCAHSPLGSASGSEEINVSRVQSHVALGAVQEHLDLRGRHSWSKDNARPTTQAWPGRRGNNDPATCHQFVLDDQ